MPTPHLSEISYQTGASTGSFVEVVLPAGTDPSTVTIVTYDRFGNVDTVYTLGTLDSTIAGADVYTIDASIHKFGAVALVVDGTTTQFVSFETTLTANGGPADGMTSTQIGATSPGESLETNDDGATYATQPTPNPGTVSCFTRDTLIETDTGPVPVQLLRPGQMIVTLDDGLQPLQWIGKRAISSEELLNNDRLQPVRIEAGALGCDLPTAPLSVSRQHRMLLRSQIVRRVFGIDEVLIPAIKLTVLPRIEIAQCADVEYYHLLFDRHQIVYANGAPSETLFIGPHALDGFDAATQCEIMELYPQRDWQSEETDPARPIVQNRDARILLERHLKNRKPVIEAQF